MFVHENTIQKLIEEIDKSRNSYGSVLVKSVIIKSERGWINCATKFVPSCSLESEKHDEKLDYGDLVFLETDISVDSLIEFVKGVPNRGGFSFSFGGYEVEFGVNGVESGPRYEDSGEDLLGVDWFFRRFQFRGENQHYPKEPIANKGLPLFPSLSEAVQEYLHIDRSSYTDIYGVFVCLPNYEAKIEQVRVGPKQITMKIKPNLLDEKSIIGKVRYQRGFKIRHVDIEFKSETETFAIEFMPELLYVALLSKINSELIDRRRYYSSWGKLPKGVTINVPNYEIEELIRQGESETVEFKQQISIGEKMAITAVAFANNRGGAIIFGVNDYGEIIGVKDGKNEDQITNILRNNCNPPIDFEILKIPIEEKEVIIAHIREGTNKPYFARRRGPYIRVNATNKHLNRYELDEILEVKKSNSNIGY